MKRKVLYLICLLASSFPLSLPAQEVLKESRINLGPGVNSAYDEVYPLISPDGNILYFVRKGHPENIEDPDYAADAKLRYKDDIWYSVRDKNGDWQEAVNIGAPLNNKNYNYVCGVLPDNNSLLLGNVYLPRGAMKQGVSISYRTAEGWSEPEQVQFEEFSNTQQFSEYTISPHANTLIMSIAPVEGYRSPTNGRRDLYVSFKNDDGTWSAPENLGPDINSVTDDITPYLASDGLTLYFSSARDGGMGKNDVYMSRRLDETWKRWTTPRNVGHPVNTAGWDAYFTVPGEGEFGYVVSTSDPTGVGDLPFGYGKSDIYRVKLAKSVAPNPILIVSGEVKDEQGNVIPATIVYERLRDSKEMGTASVNPATGAYKIALPAGEIYGFRADADGYFAVSENIDLKNLESYDEIQRPLTLKPATAGTTFTLKNIFFDFNTATLRPESKAELDRLTTFMENNATMQIEIAGHTDSVGTDKYNIELSQNRAQAVVDYLISRGIGAERLKAVGYGEAKPIAPNMTEEGRQRNRRVEFTIL
ncbi:MAG: flagellar motor protein MotB [Ectothiorhodospiraceae bacterium]|nr:flagellar motor protein MotB [Ectothiorhodospiraceae bacterium]